ncbi:MAG: right-handed parallel beta-helix repeat-containing protein [Fibrobacterota bacterium]
MSPRPVILLLSFLLYTVSAETVVSGVISRSVRWTAGKSPYIVTNDILIKREGRLVIEPGVEILVEKPTTLPADIEQLSKSDSFTVSIRVQGALRCKGTPHEPIILRGRYVDERFTHWGGVVLESERFGEVAVAYTHILNALRGITVQEGSPLIRNVLVRHSTTGIAVSGLAAPRIMNCVITETSLAGARVRNAHPYFYNSVFYDNYNIGIWGDGRSDFVFEYNLVSGSGDRNFVGTPLRLGVLSEENAHGDSVDIRNNLTADPLFAGTPAARARRRQVIQDSLAKTLDTVPPEDAVRPAPSAPAVDYRLSPYSPAIDAGHGGKKFREPDGSRPDLGIWGGPEFIEF